MYKGKNTAEPGIIDEDTYQTNNVNRHIYTLKLFSPQTSTCFKKKKKFFFSVFASIEKKHVPIY